MKACSRGIARTSGPAPRAFVHLVLRVWRFQVVARGGKVGEVLGRRPVSNVDVDRSTDFPAPGVLVL